MQNCLGRFSKSSTFTSERNCPSRCQFGGSFNYGGTFKVFYFLGRSFQLDRFISTQLYQSNQKYFIFVSVYCGTWLLHIEVVHELVDAVLPVEDVDPGDGDVEHLRHQLVALLLVGVRAAVAPPAVSLRFLTRTSLGLTWDCSTELLLKVIITMWKHAPEWIHSRPVFCLIVVNTLIPDSAPAFSCTFWALKHSIGWIKYLNICHVMFCSWRKRRGINIFYQSKSAPPWRGSRWSQGSRGPRSECGLSCSPRRPSPHSYPASGTGPCISCSENIFVWVRTRDSC